MVIHVGINLKEETLSYYNDAKKCITNLNIVAVDYDEIDKVHQMFEDIISKINETPGCLCIYLDSRYGNGIRKKFIQEGLQCGFKNVEFINWYTAIYLNAMSQTKCKPKNGDIIWIISGLRVFIWKINDHKAKFVCYDSFCMILNDLKKLVNKYKGPDVALYDDEHCEGSQKTETHKALKKISKCKFFVYKWSISGYNRALIKARITAGDCEMFHLDVENTLQKEISLCLASSSNFDTKMIKEFLIYHQLPINYSQILKNIKPIFDLLNVNASQWQESFDFPTYDSLKLTFTMDTNEIFTLTFNEHDSSSEEARSNARSITKKLKSFFFQTPSTSTSCYTIPKCLTQLSPNIDAIGIDLGTSRCCAAVNRKNGITTVPLDNTGERLLPSYVAYDEKNVKCGKIVISRLRHHSKSTIFDSKRIIGKTFNDIEINDIWDFSVCHENEKIFLEVNGFNEKKKLSAEEVAAELLKLIKQKTEEFQGRHLSQAVITIPAAFSESQTASTKEAAKIAQWQSVHLLPEPVAAAFAYFVDRQLLKNSNVLVFDLGGGTLDVCIFKIENNQIRIISNTGDTNLGGRDFDTILINYFKNILLTKYGISKIRDKNYKLMLECQRIKEELSTAMDSSLDVDEIDSIQEGSISITREEFEKMTSQLLNKIKNTIHAALYHSKYEANQINKVLQVGGGSRMPMIKQLLLEIFPQADHICEEHPDEVVAIGAAYYAYNVFSK